MTTIAPALSGMLAATARLGLSAQNVANAQSVGRAPDQEAGAKAYQAQQLVQTSTPSGVATAKRPQSPGYFFAYEPDEPGADADGKVAVPDVDPAVERVNQMQALNQFKANLQALLAGDEMNRTLLKTV